MADLTNDVNGLVPPPEDPPRSAFDPIRLIMEAADQDADPLITTLTLRLCDGEGLPTGFISGVNLTQAMPRVYREAFGDMAEARLARLHQIQDWRLDGELIGKLRTILVETILDALSSDKARMIQLCYTMNLRAALALPRDLWWTPYTIEQLRRANPHHEDLPSRVALINTMLTAYVVRYIPRRDLPLQLETRQVLSQRLGSYIESVLTMV